MGQSFRMETDCPISDFIGNSVVISYEVMIRMDAKSPLWGDKFFRNWEETGEC